MEQYLMNAGIYRVVMALLAWRVRVDLRHKQPLGQTATWLIYMIPYAVITLIRWVTPQWPRVLYIIVMVLWILSCGVVSYLVHSRYNKWLDAEREKDKYNR